MVTNSVQILGSHAVMHLVARTVVCFRSCFLWNVICFIYFAGRPFRLPAILVGDGRLGGISGTISAYETLKLRGYDIDAVVIEDHGLVNEVPLQSYLRQR